MVRSAPSQSRLSAAQAIFFISLLAFAVGLGLWFWGDHLSASASTLSSAPACAEAGQRDCLAAVSVTSERTWMRTACSGRTASCYDIHMLTVRFPDGRSQDLRMVADRIPVPEFAPGQQLTARVYNGVVEAVEGPSGTRLKTFTNPAVQSGLYHKYAAIVAGSGVPILLFAGFLTMRRGSRARPDAVAAYE